MFDSFLNTVSDFFSGEASPRGSANTSEGDASSSAAACCAGSRESGKGVGAIVARGVDSDAIGDSPRANKKGRGNGLRSFLRLMGMRSDSPKRKKRDREKRHRQRALIMKELIDTERDYVRDLRIIVDVFYAPLKAKGILKEKDASRIFGSIPLMLNLNAQLLESLEMMQVPSLESVCDVFLKVIPFFKMYSSFVDSFEGTNALVAKLKRTKPKMRKVLEKCLENEAARGLELESYLIKPVQRLLKYPLFFRDLVRKTQRRNPAYKKLERVQEMMQNVASTVNEKTREREALEQAFTLISEIEAESAKATIALRQRLTEAHRKLKFVADGVSVDAQGRSARYSIAVFSDIVLLLLERRRRNVRCMRVSAEACLEKLTWTVKDRKMMVVESDERGALKPFAVICSDDPAAADEDADDSRNGDAPVGRVSSFWKDCPSVCLLSKDTSDVEHVLKSTREARMRTRSDLEQRRAGSNAASHKEHKDSDMRRWLQLSRGDVRSIADLRRRYLRKHSNEHA